MQASSVSIASCNTLANPATTKAEHTPDPGLNHVPLPAEAVDLRRLIEHSLTIDALQTLNQAHSRFSNCAADFFAVLDGETVQGLCARNRIGFILSSRYGFALYSNTPVSQAMTPAPLFIKEGTSTRAILDAAFARSGEAFFEDVILVDSNDKLVGLISAQRLVHLQSRLVSDQFAELYRQHEATRKQNLELFQLNNALRQSQALYLALFESHSLGVALLDVRGMLRTCNRKLNELMAFSPSDTEPNRLVQRLQEHERSGLLAVLATHERHSDEHPQINEYILEIPNRGPRRFRVTTSWIQETGQISACFDDVTEKRALESMMIREEKQLMLDTMVGGIAHELNNKLTPVLGFAELLRQDSNQRTRYCAQNIGRSVEEAAHIIRQLLQLAKPSTHKLVSIDLRQALTESLTMLKFKLQDSGCTVNNLAPPSPVPVLADLSQLKQVVINLVINALQAMEGRPHKALKLQIWSNKKSARLSISDTGVGIPDEIIGRIFDPFFTTKGPDRGTGLGLSICTSIMQLHNGDIMVESEPDKGSTFTITLPLNADQADGAQLKTVTSRSPFKSCARAQILAVDDESVLRNVLQEMLHSCFNCSVDLAQNGVEALEAISNKQYDLIVSDIRMPVMDGTELYSRLKEMNHAAATRFVFMTGHAGDKDLETKIGEWGIPVISKPFRLSRLSEVCYPYLISALPPRQIDLPYVADKENSPS